MRRGAWSIYLSSNQTWPVLEQRDEFALAGEHSDTNAVPACPSPYHGERPPQLQCRNEVPIAWQEPERLFHIKQFKT